MVEVLTVPSCPRCRGFLYANRDLYGNYNECLQCGYMIDFGKPGNIRARRPSYVLPLFAPSDGTEADPIPTAVHNHRAPDLSARRKKVAVNAPPISPP